MTQTDHLSEEGARALARRIRDYWRERDREATTFIAPITFGAAGDGKGAAFAVRSDMINGYPRPVRA